MTVKWYYFAELFGFIKYVENEDGVIETAVSSKCSDFFGAISSVFFVAFMTLLFLLIFKLYKNHKVAAVVTPIALMGYFILRGSMLMMDKWIVIELYPRGGGFIDLSELGHFLEMCFLVISVFMVSCTALLIRLIMEYKARKSAKENEKND